MPAFSSMDRIDGFAWDPPHTKHGHEGDCVHVYGDGDIAWKAVFFAKDPVHPRHRNILRRAYDTLRTCDHPNVMRVMGWRETRSYAATSMPRYRTTLDEVYPHLTYEERHAVRQDIVAAVRHLFEHGIVHGDLVAKNLLWDDNAKVPILFDFQTARRKRQRCGFDESLDVVGEWWHTSCCGRFRSTNLQHLLTYELPP